MVTRAACPVAIVTSTRFLGLDRLVQSVAPFPPFRHAAGEFIDDHDLALADDIMAVEQKGPIGADRPLDEIVEPQHADRLQGRLAGRLRTTRRPAAFNSAVFFSWSYS